MLSDEQLVDSQVLRGVARVLELSAVTTTTAFAFLHRVQLSQRGCDLPRQELVSACAYLAAKVEEVHVSTNQLINTARVLCDPTQQQLLQVLAPLRLQQQQQQQQHGSSEGPGSHLPLAAAQGGPPADGVAATQRISAGQAVPHHQPTAGRDGGPSSPAGSSQQQQQQQQQQAVRLQDLQSQSIVTGDGYYAAKEQLFMAEQVVLRLMRFELAAEQPHKHLLNFCNLLQVSNELAAAAVCVLNDVVAYTDAVCRHQAAVVAAAALQYGRQVDDAAQKQRERKGQEGVGAAGWAHHDQANARSGRRGGANSHSSRRESREHSSRDAPDPEAMEQWVTLVGLQHSEVLAVQQEIGELYQRCDVT